MSSSFSLLMGSAGFAFGRRFKSNMASAKYTDFYWSNVTLLLTGDNLIDSSTNEQPLVVNDTYVSSNVKHIGTGSLAISETGGVSISNASNLLGAGNYTIEFWFKTNKYTKKYVTGETLTGVTDMLGCDDYPVEFWKKTNTRRKPYETLFKIGTANGYGLACTRTGIYGSQTGNVIAGSNVTGYSIYGFGSTELQQAYDSGNWHHICITKSSAGLMLFIDGWVVGNPITDISSFTATDFHIGSGVSSGFSGYIDDFRITKGIARHTNNFLIDTTPLPVGTKNVSTSPVDSVMLLNESLLSFDLSYNSFLYMGG